jgi:hypothetical protein
MARALALFASALLSLAAAPAQHGQPTVRIADPKSLDDVIRLDHFPASEGGKSRGDVYWRLNIDLPPHASIDRVELIGLMPPVLRLKDGRCFDIKFDMDPNAEFHLKDAAAERIDCPAARPDTTVDFPPLQRPGMTFIARAFDLDAYADRKTGETMLFEDRQKSPVPLLTTSMRVIGASGMGCPDCGATSVRLLGYVKRQLTLADVEMNIAYFDQAVNGSRTRIVSSRSGEVLTSATGQRISSSMRRTYLIARAGRSAQLRAPWVDPGQPSISS